MSKKMLEGFYQQVLKDLKAANEKFILDVLITNISKVSFLSLVVKDTSEIKKEIALLWRDKLYELVLSEGDVFEKEYLLLQVFFMNLDLPQDERFMPYVQLGISQLQEADSLLETAEKVVFIEFMTVCLFLSGNHKQSIDTFIQSMSVLYLIDVVLLDQRSEFILTLFEILQIPFEDIEPVLLSMFEVKSFFNFSHEARRNLLVWVLHQWWNVPAYFNHLGWLKLYPQWREIFYRALREDFELAVYMQFFIYHVMGNSFQTQEEWKGFNDLITKKAEPYYIEYGKTLPPCKKEVNQGKKIIGILRDRLVENAPFKVEYSFLKAFFEHESLKEKYEFRLYLMGMIEKSDDAEEIIKDYQDLGVQVINPVKALNQEHGYYASHLQRALLIRERIINDGVDILISPNNGYGISDFILATRSAPKQIFWSHGNTSYDIAGIDQRLSHIPIPGFKMINVAMDVKTFYDPPITLECVQEEESKYPKNKIKLGVIGRLVKVDSEEYLKTIAEILHKHENTIFIAAGHGNYASVREKLQKLNISEDRFFMPGHIDPHVYGHIIDIFCDTFPLAQGESLYECIYKGKAWISLAQDGYNESFKKANFSQDLIDLKHSNDLLIHIDHLENYSKDTQNWYEFLDTPNENKIILLYSKQDAPYLQNVTFKHCIPMEIDRSKEEVKLLTDIFAQVKNNTLSWDKTHLLNPKPLFFSILPYFDNGIEVDIISTRYVSDHPEIFKHQQTLSTLYVYGYSIEYYKLYLSKMITDHALREKIATAIKNQLTHFFNLKKDTLIKDCERIFSVDS